MTAAVSAEDYGVLYLRGIMPLKRESLARKFLKKFFPHSLSEWAGETKNQSAGEACGEKNWRIMFLHAGSNTVIKKKDIIGIFDIDSQTTPEATKKFLRKREKEGLTEMAGYDLPKSFILVNDKKKDKVVFSHLSTKTLEGRAELPLT